MSPSPTDPPIFHITHLTNLAGILRDGCLWCDAQCIRRNATRTNIGYRHIKERRLRRPVPVSAGGNLGDYVPFNFCPRSVMLYVVQRGHEDYEEGGQDKILHLVSSVSEVNRSGRPWAFTDRHAELGYAEYYDVLQDLDQVPWHVMRETYWQDVKEERQAEFLVHDHLPWSAIVSIGVYSQQTKVEVCNVIAGTDHRPEVEVAEDWYY